MHRLILPFLLLLLVTAFGCASHSSRYNRTERIEPCPTFPCGAEIVHSDMVLNYVVHREPTGEFVLTGTLMPQGLAPGAQVDFIVLDFDLARDITLTDSYSFPVQGRTLPFTFTKRFTPNGGFDGISFTWDVQYVKR